MCVVLEKNGSRLYSNCKKLVKVIFHSSALCVVTAFLLSCFVGQNSTHKKEEKE